MEKYHIEPNSVQETLIVPLVGRKICSERFPDLFSDEAAVRICNMLDYDFASKERLFNSTFGLYGALETAQRQYDLQWEATTYLQSHPNAAVVNLGCGLDGSFTAIDNGSAHGYNIDLPDVIEVRNELLPAGDREYNIASDLTDYSWMDAIDASQGAVFIAAGVFYYLKKEAVRDLFCEMAQHFPGAVLAFDSCNARGAKMMMKTVLKEMGITDATAYFSLEDPAEIEGWSEHFASVSSKSYMRGYRDIKKHVGLIHRLLTDLSEGLTNMLIVRIEFAER